MPHKGKGKTRRVQREKGKLPPHHLSSNSTWHPYRAHARTKRNDFPVGVTPQPPMLHIYTCTHAKIHLDSCTLFVTIRVTSKMCCYHVQCAKLAFHTLMCWQSISTRLNSNIICNLLGMTSTSTSLNSVSPNVFDSSIVMFHKGV